MSRFKETILIRVEWTTAVVQRPYDSKVEWTTAVGKKPDASQAESEKH